MIGKRIRELRKMNKLSQDELASFFNVERSTVAKWESEQSAPDYRTIIKVAKHFNVSADYLLGMSDQPGQPNPEAGKGPYEIGLAGDIEKLTEEEKSIIKAIIDKFRSAK